MKSTQLMKPIDVWLGTEESFNIARQAYDYQLQHPEKASVAANLWSWGGGDDGEEDDDGRDTEFSSRLIDVYGTTGVIRIHGSLVSTASWVNLLFGLTGYPEIIAALAELSESDDIDTILLDIDSNGGAAAGLDQVSDAISRAKVLKTVRAHTSGAMMSAAMWIAASTERIGASKMAEAGSVGALIVHRSVYKALEDSGVEYTLFRGGKYKALGHPAEKLSEAAREMLEEKVQANYGFFLEHMVTERSQLSIANKNTWAEGLTFFAESALAVGLIDEVTTLSNTLEVIEKFDKSHQSSNNHSLQATTEGQPQMKKTQTQTVLGSEEDAAALENGADISGLEHQTAETEMSGAEGDETAETAETAETEMSGAEGDETRESAAESGTALAEVLRTNQQLGADLARTQLQLEQAQTALQEAETSMASLREIVIHHIERMNIALHASPIDMSDLPVPSVLAHHSKVRKSFEEQFKVGQISKPADVDKHDAVPGRGLGIFPKQSA